MFDLFIDNRAMSDLVIGALTILATFWCARHTLKLHRLSEELRKYSRIKNQGSRNIIPALFEKKSLDKHEKILRSDAIISFFPITLFFIWTAIVILANSP